MAGGVANIWGNLKGDRDSWLGSAPYPQPHWIQTNARFFRSRFIIDMVRDNAITDGVCLRRPTQAHYVFYKEDTDSIRLDLSKMKGKQPVVAVDTTQPYKIISLGMLQPKEQQIKLPRRSDWAIAVGDFGSH